MKPDILKDSGASLKHLYKHNLLPNLLSKRAKTFTRARSLRSEQLELISHDLSKLEDLLKHYQLDFPFFTKVDAWKTTSFDEEHDLWVLERIGWGVWKESYQLLFCLEALPIPKMPDAEVVSVNSASPPFLAAAQLLDWTKEIQSEDVLVSPLSELPLPLKEKAYPCLDELVWSLADTINQMESYQEEFQCYLEDRIQEYLERFDQELFHSKAEAIQSYFRSERRVELFYEFLESLGEAGRS